MEKILNLEFNQSGVLVDYDLDEIRQGDVGVVVKAKFTGKNNAFYVARLNLTRPDETHIDNVIMNADSLDSEVFTKKLDSAWFFAKDGETTLTVFLVDGSGNELANGQVNFDVQKTDYSDDPTITPDQYLEILSLIATKLNIKDGIKTFESIQDVGSYDDYEAEQFMFIKNGGALFNNHAVLVQLNAQKTALNKIFDFTDIKASKVDSINLAISRNATNNVVNLQLLDENGLAIATAIATIHPASSTYAGLMTAQDKSKLSDLPTGQEIEDTYETKQDADASHQDLQEQIDAIVDKADVVDIVGTYAELQAYDTSKLGDNDIIKVLVDETHQNQRSYYRWNKTNEEFDYIGSEGLSYTKAESDLLFLTKVEATTKFAKKQNKVKVVQAIPSPDDLEENDVIVIPSVEEGDYVVGDGLKLVTDAQTGIKTLLVDSQTIATKEDLDPKQNTISDLDTIRSGAALGATALQSVPNTYRTASDQDVIDSSFATKEELEDYTPTANLGAVATSNNYNDLDNKPTIKHLYKHIIYNVGGFDLIVYSPRSSKYQRGALFAADEKISIYLRSKEGYPSNHTVLFASADEIKYMDTSIQTITLTSSMFDVSNQEVEQII